MFGYLTVNQDELKVRQLRTYKACYCGLCHMLRSEYGFLGQMTLTYDLTFAVLLLSSLYEETMEGGKRRCKVHPVKKQPVMQNEITKYAAHMNVLLAYYKAQDDVNDDGSKKAYILSKIFSKKAAQLEKTYERQAKVIRENLSRLALLEKQVSQSIDETAGCFGRLMGEVLVMREDMWSDSLRRLGFFLGKFIYIMDAWEDVEEDVKKGRFNALKKQYKEMEKDKFDKYCLDMMTLMMGEAAAEFEKLPCLMEVDILRNILYDGVWNRYRRLHEKTSNSGA